MNTIKLKISLLAALLLLGCEQSPSPAENAESRGTSQDRSRFIDSVKKDLVFVAGGEFFMGDYGPRFGAEKLPFDMNLDSSPLHKVELSSYSISRFKITNYEFQFYLKSNGLALREKGGPIKEEWDAINSTPNTPAHLDWFEADSYCKWLSTLTGEPFALPTEAQWEYAARSRGQFLMVATDDGTYKAEPMDMRTESYEPKGINISSDGDRTEFATKMGWTTESFTPLPVNMFPPNPLGLYSMSDNGYEWVSDWYDPNYYAHSPAKDPQGPENPVFKGLYGYDAKVIRGQNYANPYWGGGVNVYRRAADPYGRIDSDGWVYLGSKTARCVVNNPGPVK